MTDRLIILHSSPKDSPGGAFKDFTADRDATADSRGGWRRRGVGLHPGRRTRRAEVDECSSAEAALGALRAGHYDALVLELLLPGTYGLEILRDIASSSRPRRIVVLTRWRSGASGALKAGAHVVVAKPCTAPTLRAALGFRSGDEDEATRSIRLMVERSE